MSKWTTYLVEDYLGIKDHDPKLYGYNFSKKTHNLRFYKSKFSSKIYVDFMSGDIERIKTASRVILGLGKLRFTQSQVDKIEQATASLPKSEKRSFRDYRDKVKLAVKLLNHYQNHDCKCLFYRDSNEFDAKKEIEIETVRSVRKYEKDHPAWLVECNTCETKWKIELHTDYHYPLTIWSILNAEDIAKYEEHLKSKAQKKETIPAITIDQKSTVGKKKSRISARSQSKRADKKVTKIYAALNNLIEQIGFSLNSTPICLAYHFDGDLKNPLDLLEHAMETGDLNETWENEGMKSQSITEKSIDISKLSKGIRKIHTSEIEFAEFKNNINAMLVGGKTRVASYFPYKKRQKSAIEIKEITQAFYDYLWKEEFGHNAAITAFYVTPSEIPVTYLEDGKHIGYWDDIGNHSCFVISNMKTFFLVLLTN